MKELEDLKTKIQNLEKDRDEFLRKEVLIAKNQNLMSKSILDCANQINIISTALHSCLDRIEEIDAEFTVFKESLGLKKQQYNFFIDGTTYN